MHQHTASPLEVAPGVFRVPSRLGERHIAQWLVVGDAGVALIDTGVFGTVREQLLPALEALGRAPEHIVDVANSHADVDHYGGNAEVRAYAPRARIRCGARDRAMIESWPVIARDRYGWYERHGLNYDREVLAWLRDAAGPDTRVDGVLGDGDVLDLGGPRLRVLELPGHSAGHLGFLVEGSGCAIVADAVLERGLYDVEGRRISPPPYVTVDGYRRSIATLQALDLDRLETAHYGSVDGEDADAFLAASAAFVDELDAIVRDQIADRSRTVAEITSVADGALGPFSAMALELGRSVGAHLDALTAAGVARQLPGEPPRWIAI